MPKQPAASEENSNSGPAIDPQKQYLMDQFGNLMEQVGEGFGGPLQEELISRLQQTIADFHEEVNEMLTRLKDNSEKRHEKLKEIWNNPEASTSDTADEGTSDVSNGPGLSTEEMSEWEKKIESSADNSEEKPAKEEKKKGFFGRKKK